MAIKDARTVPERMEVHANKNWFDHGFNHKTTLTMGNLVPLGAKEVYPGERVKCYAELAYKFAALFLPIMHQCYHTIDWFYVRTASLFSQLVDGDLIGNNFEIFMKQDPNQPVALWSYFKYTRANAVSTNGILNYLGFNAPPGSGTLILDTKVSAIPVGAYYSIWTWFYRNPNIQANLQEFFSGTDETTKVQTMLPGLIVKRRNWPRDYYTVATPSPQQGANVLIPSFAKDPMTGDYITQPLYNVDGTNAGSGGLSSAGGITTGKDVLANDSGTTAKVLQLSSTIRDFRMAAQMTEFLERATRAGARDGDPSGRSIRWSDWVKRYFDWDPNPLMIDQPVWIGGYTGQLIISDVMSTAEAGTQKVGDYAGKAVARDNTPSYMYKVPDYGLIIPVISVYPKASYYTGAHRMWTRMSKMDYMFEQFQYIGDQPMRNKEVWFSWYDADVAWNDEIFGYVPQYHSERYSTDIVSGQMRTLWESFHLGRKFVASTDVVLNEEFIECKPDIGRVFDVDADGGEHECFLHAYVGIEIERRLSRNAVPGL